VRVLVACEYSARVRDAFRRRGHNAWSCDLLPTDGDPKYHFQCDVREVLKYPWDLLIAHPPCTYLARSGLHHNAHDPDRRLKSVEALRFVVLLMKADIRQIAVENPVGLINSKIRKPEQIIQPWQFGHGETKATCLWLKNLPPLKPTKIVPGREQRLYNLGPGDERWKERSATFVGVAQAMAEQWG
jgi:site-specific DNA-cytosine methylase